MKRMLFAVATVAASVALAPLMAALAQDFLVHCSKSRDSRAHGRRRRRLQQRQAAMTLIGKYFGHPLGGMAQGKVPYNAHAYVVQRNAGYLDNLSRMPWDGFDPRPSNPRARSLLARCLRCTRTARSSRRRRGASRTRRPSSTR